MDDGEIVRLIGDLETDLVERKESLSDPDRVSEAICAFANDLPGHRAPGVVGGRRWGRRCWEADRAESRRRVVPEVGRPPGQRQDLSLPLADRVSCEPRRRPRGGRRGGAIRVAAGEFRGRTWVRVGPRRAVATPEEETRLAERRRLATLPFDARPVAGATLADLDLARFSIEILPQLVAADVLAENERSPEQQLAGLQLADVSGTPTAAGLLFLGRDPLAWLPAHPCSSSGSMVTTSEPHTQPAPFHLTTA